GPVIANLKMIRGLFSVVLTIACLQSWLFLPAYSQNTPALSPEAAQCASILGILPEAEQIVSARHSGVANREILSHRAHALRKIFQGVLQVQSAESHLEMEMNYTYNLMAREQRRIGTVNQLFNVANFLQFGVLYTIEPASRIHHQFTQSAICTV